MSTVVDERIVEMRFDNKQFESNVSTTMSTIDKLKQKLNFKGASQGLENIGSSAKKVDFSGMSSGISTVHAKFSALEVMGVTALANITNSAINAGKRIVSALTIDPVSDGWSEYEMTLNAVQTTMAGTGKTAKEVEAELKKLDEYADKTIYSTADMLNNLPKFTNAGVDLEKATTAMIGIANATAIAGGDANKASIAFYNLGQSIGTGYLTRMDYNSINNAGIATMEWKNQMVEAAIAAGTLAKVGDDLYQAGNKTYSLQQLFIDGLQEQWATADVLMKVFQDYGDETTEIGKKAYAAAQDVKTFSQLMESLKATAGTGWKDTWQIVFGDLDQAKEFWTGISNVVGGFISKQSKWRNDLLGSAFGKGLTDLGEKINSILEPAKEIGDTIGNVTEPITNVAGALEDLGAIVDDVIIGKFGNGQERFDALTKAGQNYYEVQNKVNEKLGDSYRYSQDQIDAQNELLGVQNQTAKSTEEVAGETADLTKDQKELIKSYAKLNDEQLESKGFTKDQIKAFKELRKTADKLGMSVDDLVDNMDEINGRWLLLKSLENIGSSIAKVFKSVAQAFGEVFDALDADDIFDAIAAFHKFSTYLVISDETAEKLTRTFKGLFSILHIISTIADGAFKIAFQVLSEILSRFDMNILDVTAKVGDLVSSFDEFLSGAIAKGVEKVVDVIMKVADAVDKLINKIVNSEFVQTIKETFTDLFDALFGDSDAEKPEGFVSAISEVSGAIDELNSGDKTSAFSKISEGLQSLNLLANSKWAMSLTSGLKIFNAVLELFGTNLSEIGTYVADYIHKAADWVEKNTFLINTNQKIAKVLEVLITGIKDCAKAFLELEPVQKIIQKVKDLISDLFGDISKGFNGGGIDALIKSIGKAFESVQEWIKSLKNSENLGADIVSGLANGIRAGIGMAVNAILAIGQAIIDTFCNLLGIHSPSTFFHELGKNVVQGLGNGIKAALNFAVESITSLGKAIVNAFKNIKLDFGPLGKAFETLKGYLKDFDWSKLAAIIPIGLTVYLGKQIFKIVDVLESGVRGINGVLKGFEGVLGSLSGVFKSMQKKIKTKAIKNLAISIAILAGAVVALTLVDQDKLWDAVGVIIVLSAVVAALAFAVSKMDSASADLKKGEINIDGIKSGLIAIGASILMLAAAVKIIGELNPKEAERGLIGLASLAGGMIVFMAAMATMTKISKEQTKDIAQLGNMMLKLAVAMALMVVVVKLIDTLEPGQMVKGAAFAAAFAIFVKSIAKVAKDSGQYVSRVGGMMIKLTIAMGLMVGVVKLVGLLSVGEMLKGLAFAAGFSAFVAAIVLISKIFPQAQKISGLVLSVSFSMLLMVAMCKLVGMLSVEEMTKGVAFMAAFMLLLKALVKITTIGSKEQIAKVSATILAMSVAIGILAAVSVVLSLMPLDGLAKGITAVGLLATFMALMIKSLKGASEVNKTMLMMSVAIGVMAASIVVLSLLDPKKLAGATGALSIVMGMFALMTKASSDVKASFGAVALMVIVTAMLAGIISQLGKMEIGSTIETAGSLSLLMLALAASLKIIDKTSVEFKKGIGSVAVMLTALLGIAAILTLLKTFDVQPTLETSASLSVLLLSLSAAMVIASHAGSLGMDGLKNVGVMLAMLAGIGLILGLLAKFNVGPTLEIAASLSLLLLSLSAACLIMSAAAGVAVLASAGITPLTVLIIKMGVMMAAIAALATWIPDLETFLSKALPILKLIGEGIGEFLGGIILGIGTAVMELLPRFGMALSAFMVGLTPFIQLSKTIDSSVVSGIGYLSLAILELSAANMISGIMSFRSFGQSFAELGSHLSDFILNAMPFFTMMQDIDPSVVESANLLAQTVLILTAADLIERITPFSKMSFGDFGSSLSDFGTGIAQFADSVSGLSDDTLTKVNIAAKAGKTMAEMVKTLPSTSIWNNIIGFKDLDGFGESLASFGESLVAFASSISGLTEEDISRINTAADAGSALAEMANSLPSDGGLWQHVIGFKDLEGFGESLEAFGTSLVAFASSISGLNEEDAGKIETATNAATKLVDLANALPSTDGLWQRITGFKNLAGFGDSLKNLGSGISGYVKSIKDLDDSSVESIEDSGAAIDALVAVAEKIPSSGGVGDKLFGGKDISGFGNGIRVLGLGIKTFVGNITGITEDDIASIDMAKSAVEAAAKVSDKVPEDSEKIQNTVPFINSVNAIADNIKTFITNVSGIEDASLTSIDTAGQVVAKMNTMYSNVPEDTEKSANAVPFIDSMIALTGKIGDFLTNVTDSGISEDALVNVENTKQAIKKIASMADAVPEDLEKSNNAESFINSMITLVGNVKTFITDATGVTEDNITTIDTVKRVVAAIVSVSKKIPSDMEKTNNSTAFISKMINLVNNVKTFITSAKGISDDDITAIGNVKEAVTAIKNVSTQMSGVGTETVSLAITNIKGLSSAISAMTGADYSGVDDFKAAVETLGTVEVDNIVNSFTGAATRLTAAGRLMMDGLVNGIKSKGSGVKAAITTIITAATNTIKSKNSQFLALGKTLMTKLTNGIKDKKESVKNAIGTCLSGAATKIRSYYSSFKSAGKYLGDGLVAGINAKKQAAYDAGYALGQKAAQGEKDGQQSESPSKLTIQAGKWLGEGLIIGIEKMGSKVYNSAYDMGHSAVRSISNAISNVSDVINSGLDSEPTIRPVLDLSEIQNGAGAINGMFNNPLSIGANANLNAIGSMMVQRNQNGVNDDVVSAINKLRKDLGSVGGTTNIINGITYDDGSNIANAVGAIVRAANLERRI